MMTPPRADPRDDSQSAPMFFPRYVFADVLIRLIGTISLWTRRAGPTPKVRFPILKKALVFNENSNLAHRRKDCLSEGDDDYKVERNELVRGSAGVFKEEGFSETTLHDTAESRVWTPRRSIATAARTTAITRQSTKVAMEYRRGKPASSPQIRSSEDTRRNPSKGQWPRRRTTDLHIYVCIHGGMRASESELRPSAEQRMLHVKQLEKLVTKVIERVMRTQL